MNVLISKVIRPLAALVCVLLLAMPVSAATDPTGVRAEIAAMPLGTNIEVRLKDKQRLRGAKGAASESGFTLVDPHGERQIAFADVTSLKQVKVKSHTTRNILIGVGIGIGVAAIVLVSLFHASGYA